jgi:hypothetical protein
MLALVFRTVSLKLSNAAICWPDYCGFHGHGDAERLRRLRIAGNTASASINCIRAGHRAKRRGPVSGRRSAARHRA